MAETTKKSSKQAAQEAEDHTRSEISELFLLLKSGLLSVEEKLRLKARLDQLILATEVKHQQHCCGK
jgi:hypothetical protein